MYRIGLFFGGPSREREVSFAGGRTVFDNLDKSLFDPIPIFIDSRLNCVLLDWRSLYKGSIRDFYPPIGALDDNGLNIPVYDESIDPSKLRKAVDQSDIGRFVAWDDLDQHIDFGFLALHGRFGEDGQIQALLERYGIPYSGSGITASGIGMDKSLQKRWMHKMGLPVPTFKTMTYNDWITQPENIIDIVQRQFPNGCAIRPTRQGSSIGTTVLSSTRDRLQIQEAFNNAFFRKAIDISSWHNMTTSQKKTQIESWADLKSSIGLPLRIDDVQYDHPRDVLQAIDQLSSDTMIEAVDRDYNVLVEDRLNGREFSCIVLHHPDGGCIALPPTEIIKSTEVYDYRSKYLPGLSRKVTPIDLPERDINRIREDCESLYTIFSFSSYARIDGFIEDDGTIYLNDPNTTSGMLPSSFFFHQAAEIGLNPSQFLTYIIWSSLIARQSSGAYGIALRSMERDLSEKISVGSSAKADKQKIGVILGGYSFERHISVESGRNIYEKLSSSDRYTPIPLFLKKSETGFALYKLPIHLLLKDNADDIAAHIDRFNESDIDLTHPSVSNIRDKAKIITTLFSRDDHSYHPERIALDDLAELVDGVFIGLHGRPGEDGTLQRELDQRGIPYNGSNADSTTITIDKYETLSLLRAHGFKTAQQFLLSKSSYNKNQLAFLNETLVLPIVAKPVDDGCSSAVVIIRDQSQLDAYCKAIFRPTTFLDKSLRNKLGLAANDEFPMKEVVLLESLIEKGEAKHFLEVTGGLYTTYDHNGSIRYHIFDPSETITSKDILSLEEKFLAGQGTNITPARFNVDPVLNESINTEVKKDLEKAARILNVTGYARIDAFVKIFDNHIETIIIEVNSLPGMTPATCIFHQAAHASLTPIDFIDKILEFGFERTQRNKSMVL